MALLFWDASALAKRYFTETGSETVNAVFANCTTHRMASTPWGYVETYSILLRRFNDGTLQRTTFQSAISALYNEVQSPDFSLMQIQSGTVLNSVAIVQRHNLNATDAVLLNMLLEYRQFPNAMPCVIITADQRLLRAASVEGMLTLNPETFAVADVPGLLASL